MVVKTPIVIFEVFYDIVIHFYMMLPMYLQHNAANQN